jgi:hypothetical protein
MINGKLIEIIKELKKQSKTDAQIYNILVGYKVPVSEIKENLEYLEKNSLSNKSNFKNLNSDKRNKNTVLIILIILVFLINISLIVIGINRNNNLENIDNDQNILLDNNLDQNWVIKIIDSNDFLTGEALPLIKMKIREDFIDEFTDKNIGIITIPSIKETLLEHGYLETHPKMRVIGPSYQIYPQGESFGDTIIFSFCYFDQDIGNFDESLFYIGKETPDVWENIGGVVNPSQNCVDINLDTAPDYTFGVYAGLEDENTNFNGTNNLEPFTNYNFPLQEKVNFDFNFIDVNQNEFFEIDGDIYFLNENEFDINYNFNAKISEDKLYNAYSGTISEDQLYNAYSGTIMLSYFISTLLVDTYNPGFIDSSEIDMFLQDDIYLEMPENDIYLEMPENLKQRFLLLTMMSTITNIYDQNNDEFYKFSTVILNPDYNYKNFNLKYSLETDSEKLTAFEMYVDDNLETVTTKIYDLETREVDIETLSYSEIFE